MRHQAFDLSPLWKKDPHVSLSYQLYSSRKFGPLPKTLRMIADLGLSEVEGFGGLYAASGDLGQLKAELEKAGLVMTSGHFGLDMVESDPDGVREMATALGVRNVYVPYLDAADRPDDRDGWRAFGARLAEAGKPLQDAGIGFGWHNHDFEFRALDDGNYPIEAMFEGGPALAFEFDIAWAVRAGEDPFAWIERLGGRIGAAHVKDIAPDGTCVQEDGWSDVGHGTLDWTAHVAALARVGCDHLVLEHDNPSDDWRFAERSVGFLKTL